MAGHSHWAGIKHKKGAADKKRGKLFSKLSRAIIIAAQQGGGEPDANLKLRYAIEKAKQASMNSNSPSDVPLAPDTNHAQGTTPTTHP